MPRINLDMKNIGQDDLIPEDRYCLQIIEGTKSMESKNGNPQMLFKLRVTDGEYADKIFPVFASLLSHARFLFDAIVQVLPDFNFDEDGFDDEDFIGMEFAADVIVKEYEGRKSNTVKRCYTLTS